MGDWTATEGQNDTLFTTWTSDPLDGGGLPPENKSNQELFIIYYVIGTVGLLGNLLVCNIK